MMVKQETIMKNRQLKRNKTYNLVNSLTNFNLYQKQPKCHNTNIKGAIKSLCNHTNFGRLLLLLQTIIFTSRVIQFLQITKYQSSSNIIIVSKYIYLDYDYQKI